MNTPTTTCPQGHSRREDQHEATPCAWPECSPFVDTLSSPGLAEFALAPIVVAGELFGEIIGTFWREREGEGWTWKLLGTRERRRPPESPAA